MDRRIGAQYFTLRDFTKTIEDFDATCKKVAEMGYQVVQISGTPLKAADMRPILDKYGLKTIVTHRGFQDFVDNIDEIIEYNKTLGAEYCGVGSMPGEYIKSANSVTDFIQKMNKAAEAISEAGMTFAYHNHAFEFGKIDGKYIMDRLIEESDPEKVAFIVDTYWVQFAGVDAAKFVKRLGKRAAVMHFKDLMIDLDAPFAASMAEVGYGNLDWDSIIEACDEAGAKWAMVEQDICKRDPFESMKMSYEFLKTKGFC